MTSVLSQIATDSVVLEGKARVIKLSGKLASNYKPGQIVYQTAVDTWTATTGTASTNHIIPGVVEFKKRTSPTFGQKDIDDAYTYGTAINVEIIVGPRDGSLKLAVLAQNLSATKFFGNTVGATSGGVLCKNNKTGSQSSVAYITEESYTAGDTVAKVYWGPGGGISIA